MESGKWNYFKSGKWKVESGICGQSSYFVILKLNAVHKALQATIAHCTLHIAHCIQPLHIAHCFCRKKKTVQKPAYLYTVFKTRLPFSKGKLFPFRNCEEITFKFNAVQGKLGEQKLKVVDEQFLI